MKNILVVGGAGYIGSHTVLELFEANYNPIVLDNFINSNENVIERIKKITGKNVTYYKGSFQSSELLDKINKQHKIDGVIHFAAHKAVGESVENPLKYYDNNVAGFISLLDYLKNNDIKRMVFSSSAAVYGEPDKSIVNEETICLPTSPYGWSKYMDEIIIRDICKSDIKFQAIALRYFNVVGAHPSGLIGELPSGKPQNLLPIIIQSLKGKLPKLTVFGNDYPTKDGTCERDYIHVVDLAKAHVSAINKLFNSDINYDVINIGTGKSNSVLELISTFEKINNIEVPYHIGKRRPGDPAAYYASVDKAKGILGWQSSKTVEDAVRDAWNWQLTLDKE